MRIIWCLLFLRSQFPWIKSSLLISEKSIMLKLCKNLKSDIRNKEVDQNSKSSRRRGTGNSLMTRCVDTEQLDYIIVITWGCLISARFLKLIIHVHTRARREDFHANRWSQSVDTRRTPLSLHYLILMCHLENIKQSFVTENAVAREFHYECKHEEFLLRQPTSAKWNRNAIVLAVTRSVLRSGDMVIRIVWLSHRAAESQQVCLCTYLPALTHFLFALVPWGNQSVGDEWFIDVSCPIYFPVTFCIDP